MPQLTLDQAFELALANHKAGNLGDATALYREIVKLDPQHSDALHLLGMVAFQTGEAKEALALVDQAIQLRPNTSIYHNNRGQILEHLDRLKEAAPEYETAIALDPNYAEAHNNLGNFYEREENFPRAIECYRRAIDIKPTYAEAHTNLANVYKEQGDMVTAVELYRRASSLRSDLTILDSNLLFALHYLPNVTREDLAREHAWWRARHADPLKAEIRAHRNRPDPDKRLRLGYVSSDLREHPVARFMLPILQHYDRHAFEVFAYSGSHRVDAVTKKLQTFVDQWRPVMGLSDADLAELIRRDEIDILVDLSAHTSGARLLTFARKPAPVQVTYLAYCSTTGLDTIDYRITDPHLDPPGRDLSVYSETTVRLPETYWCYAAPEPSPPVAPLPAERTGQITFGCLNNFCKISADTLRTWGRLLSTMRNSRLLLHTREGSHRTRVLRALRKAGVKPARVEFVTKQSYADYLKTYDRIDIALDPFPYAGGTTTCEALWMGVPVVSKIGHTAVSRAGLSILANVGLKPLVADSEDRYLCIASELAADPASLAKLRGSLRARMMASPLMNAPRFIAHLQAAYREMWQRWCKGRVP